MKTFKFVYRDTGEVEHIEADSFDVINAWVTFYAGRDEDGSPIPFRALRTINLNEVLEA